MFIKLDKKALALVTVVSLAVILALGFVAYKYLAMPAEKAQNNEPTAGGQESAAVPQIQIQTNTGDAGLSVCVDQCGNGVCQKEDPGCNQKDSLNCICAETPQDCPQDCK